MKTYMLVAIVTLFSSASVFAADLYRQLFVCSPDGQAQMFYIVTSTHENSSSLNQYIAKKIADLGMNCSDVDYDQTLAENASYSINYDFKIQCGTGSGPTFLNELSDRFVHDVGYVVTLNYSDSRNDQPKTIVMDKDTVVITSDRFDRYSHLAEKKIKSGLKKIILKIKRDQKR